MWKKKNSEQEQKLNENISDSTFDKTFRRIAQ